MPKKTTIEFGERIAKEGRVRLGCSAAIIDESGEKILLTKRADNGQWCLPGGGVDAGEFVEETVVREVFEETGLHVRVTRFVGVYSNPNKLTIYPDGNMVHLIALSFVAEIVGGELGLSDETTDYGYFPLDEIAEMDMLAGHEERILDVLKDQPEPFIK